MAPPMTTAPRCPRRAGFTEAAGPSCNRAGFCLQLRLRIFCGTEYAMRAEIEQIAEEIKQSAGLLRRHL